MCYGVCMKVNLLGIIDCADCLKLLPELHKKCQLLAGFSVSQTPCSQVNYDTLSESLSISIAPEAHKRFMEIVNKAIFKRLEVKIM